MNSGRTIFSQLMDHLPTHDFKQCVERYRGNHKVQKFTCWDQFLCMAFAQLTYRESLRDIEACLRANQSKLYHMGFRSRVSRNNLAHANKTRDWRIYADFAHILIQQARTHYANDDFGVELDRTVYALDSTTIDLCLTLFPWACFRETKAAVKLHTLLDLRGSIPTLVVITPGKVHDVKILDHLLLEPGSIYVIDRGYLDYARLYRFQHDSAFFVTRAKSNLGFRRLYSHPVDKATGLKCDQTIVLTGYYAQKDYPEKLRRIRYLDPEQQKLLVFLTNNFSLPALTIAKLYKCPLAGGAIFQMDQATPPDQSLLWHLRERGQNSGLDLHMCLRLSGHSQKAIVLEAQPLHNSTGFECHSFREKPYFTGPLSKWIRN